MNVSSRDVGLLYHWNTSRPLNRGEHRIMGVVLLPVIVLALVGNSTVLILFLRFKGLRSRANLFILNMTVADFLMTLTNGSVLLLSHFSGRWIAGHAGCQTCAFIASLASFVSILSYSALSVDRYIVIHRTIDLQSHPSRRCVYYGVVFTWTASAVASALPFFGWGRYVLEGDRTSCTFDFFTRSANIRSQNLFIQILFFVLPLCVIVICYLSIFIAVRKHEREFRNCVSIMKFPRICNTKKTVNIELKTAKVAMIIICVFVFSWCPYFFVSLIGQYGNASLISPLASAIPGICAKIATFLNPTIYAFCNRSFRKKIRLLFYCRKDVGDPSTTAFRLQNRDSYNS